MAKKGDVLYIMLNGTRFNVPAGIEPQVNYGGLGSSEAQDNGDGSSEPYFKKKPAGITGIQVTIDDTNEDTFNELLGLESMSVVMETVGRAYELTGFIVGDVTISATKGTTSEFEIRVKGADGVRKS